MSPLHEFCTLTSFPSHYTSECCTLGPAGPRLPSHPCFSWLSHCPQATRLPVGSSLVTLRVFISFQLLCLIHHSH